MDWWAQHGDVLLFGTVVVGGLIHLHTRVARLEEAMGWVKAALRQAGYKVIDPNGLEVP